MFENQKPTALMIGRFQPWHLGHRRIFEEGLKREGQVLICVRDTFNIDEKNPYSFDEVCSNINDDLLDKYHGRYIIIKVPNITNVIYGRDVGYKIEQIKLDEETEKISATKIRELNGLGK